MNPHTPVRSFDQHHDRFLGSPVRNRILLAVLTLSVLLALTSGAGATTADSTASGHRVDITIEEILGGTTPAISGPTPLVSVAAPPDGSADDSLTDSQYDLPLGLGTLLTTGAIAVEAAGSADWGIDLATADVTIEDLELSLAGLLTLDAAAIAAGAQVLPEDEETCWSGTVNSGGATFQEATLGGSLVTVPISLPDEPETNEVVLDIPGTVTVTLNEQIDTYGRLIVHAVHIELHGLAVVGVGTLVGDIYLASADGALACGGADLSVTVAESADPALLGGSVVYTATVTNLGPERGIDALLAIPLSAAMELVSATPSRGNCSVTGQDVLCSFGDLRLDDTVTVAVEVTPVHGGVVSFAGDVAPANGDYYPDNNHFCELTEVEAEEPTTSADLSVELTDSADPITVGNYLTYTATVLHQGGSDVDTALVGVDLPFGAYLLWVVPEQGTCTGGMGDRHVSCDLGAMTASDEASVTLTTLVLVSGELEASALLSSPEADPDLTDNFDSELTQAEASGS